jgi:hypothetical protein
MANKTFDILYKKKKIQKIHYNFQIIFILWFSSIVCKEYHFLASYEKYTHKVVYF